MKYMGSKRAMLQNGLGKIIIEQSRKAERFVDLFCGAGAVSWFVSQNTDLPVFAVDLQNFAVILAKSVICRNSPLVPEKIAQYWLEDLDEKIQKHPFWDAALTLSKFKKGIHEVVSDSRELCSMESTDGPIWNAYGGYYFSPLQALTFDSMLSMLPKSDDERNVCLAALISTASKCAASPGHTAQPLQPTKTAGKFIKISWSLDPISLCKKELEFICSQYARVKGDALVDDAISVASTLHPNDLVFIDPPYSDVQYSRFYHVLETIARSRKTTSNGAGRYPPIAERPQSGFSKKSESISSLNYLLTNLHKSGSRLIFTFPEEKCSNGLSGELIRNIASKMYHIESYSVDGKFSTLGGNNTLRASRNKSKELILLMTPI